MRRRRVEELVAEAAHELRGPLTALGLAVEGLRRRGALAVEDAEALELQLRRARLALDDLALAPAGRRAPERPEPVRVDDLLARLARTWAPVAAAREVDLRIGTSGGVVVGDETRLLQAAGNLVANALEHGGGTVEVRATGRGLEVRDGGRGLPAPVAEVLARPPRGTRGHGLRIADGIARRAGGGGLADAPSGVVLRLPVRP